MRFHFGETRSHTFFEHYEERRKSRFDAVHQLGHLVLHQDGKVTGRLAEDQANAFASSFLMPQSDVLAVLPRVYLLAQIMQAKKRRKVSVAALNYRLHKLKITTDWKYRDFFIDISTIYIA